MKSQNEEGWRGVIWRESFSFNHEMKRIYSFILLKQEPWSSGAMFVWIRPPLWKGSSLGSLFSTDPSQGHTWEVRGFWMWLLLTVELLTLSKQRHFINRSDTIFRFSTLWDIGIWRRSSPLWFPLHAVGNPTNDCTMVIAMNGKSGPLSLYSHHFRI